MEGQNTEHLTRDKSDDEDTPILSIPFTVTWKPTWVSEDKEITTHSGNSTIATYTTANAPTRKKNTHIPTYTPKTTGGLAP